MEADVQRRGNACPIQEWQVVPGRVGCKKMWMMAEDEGQWPERGLEREVRALESQNFNLLLMSFHRRLPVIISSGWMVFLSPGPDAKGGTAHRVTDGQEEGCELGKPLSRVL